MALRRLRPKTKKLPNGTTVTTVEPAPPEEWAMQAEAVRRLRQLPQYDREFTLAGDFNAARRSPREATKAKATGLTPGEHDLRIYLQGGRLGLIELKRTRRQGGRLSPAQRDRHALLQRLGFNRQAVVYAADEDDAATQVVAIVLEWLAANDN